MKAKLIKQVRDILVPDDRPRSIVFWPDENFTGRFLYKGVSLTRDECSKIAARMKIFVMRKPILHEQT